LRLLPSGIPAGIAVALRGDGVAPAAMGRPRARAPLSVFPGLDLARALRMAPAARFLLAHSVGGCGPSLSCRASLFWFSAGVAGCSPVLSLSPLRSRLLRLSRSDRRRLDSKARHRLFSGGGDQERGRVPRGRWSGRCGRVSAVIPLARGGGLRNPGSARCRSDPSGGARRSAPGLRLLLSRRTDRGVSAPIVSVVVL